MAAAGRQEGDGKISDNSTGSRLFFSYRQAIAGANYTLLNTSDMEIFQLFEAHTSEWSDLKIAFLYPLSNMGKYT